MLIIATAAPTKYNLKDEMWISFFISIISFFIIANFFFKSHRNLASLILFVPVSFLFFGLFQFENILWGYQVSIYLCVLGILASLFFIWRSRTIDLNFMAAIFFGILATFSFFNGLLVWPIIFIYLIVNKKYKQSIVWAFVSVASYAVFFYGWTHPSYHPSMLYPLYHPVTSISYLIANIGTPFSNNTYTALVFGIAIILFYISSIILSIKSKSIDKTSIWFSLILFSLGTSVLCMIGRSGFGVEQALSSRYTTFTILGVIGVYSIFVDRYLSQVDNRKIYKIILIILSGIFILGLIFGNVHGLNEGKSIANSRQYEITLLNNYDNLTDSQKNAIYPDPSTLNNYVAILKKYNISYHV